MTCTTWAGASEAMVLGRVMALQASRRGKGSMSHAGPSLQTNKRANIRGCNSKACRRLLSGQHLLAQPGLQLEHKVAVHVSAAHMAISLDLDAVNAHMQYTKAPTRTQHQHTPVTLQHRHQLIPPVPGPRLGRQKVSRSPPFAFRQGPVQLL